MSKFRLNRVTYLPQPNYTQTVAIDGYQYTFDFRWNRRLNCHFLSISDAFGNVNLQRKKLTSGTSFYPENLPSNSDWFLTYVNRGNSTVLDRPRDHGLGAFVLE